MPDSIVFERDIVSVQNDVSDAEWEARVNLAAAYRIAHHFGWNDTIRNHITMRVPDAPDQFLINPLGLGWHEICASDIIKADMDGNILSSSDLKPGPAGFSFHRAILSAKDSMNATIHLHPMEGIAVSALEEGLMIVDQSACALYNQVVSHGFEGLAEEAEEGPAIAEELGDKFAMLMANHGLLTVGRTIGEAFVYMERLINACKLQTTLMATGGKIRPLPEELIRHTWEQMFARRGNTPMGGLDFKMYVRLAYKLDPGFAR